MSVWHPSPGPRNSLFGTHFTPLTQLHRSQNISNDFMIFMIGLLGCQCSGNWSTLTSLFAELAAFRQAGPCQAGRNDALRLGPAWVADGLMRWWLSRPVEHWNIYGSPIPNPFPAVVMVTHSSWGYYNYCDCFSCPPPTTTTTAPPATATATATALLLLLLLPLLLPMGKNGKGFSSFFHFFL